VAQAELTNARIHASGEFAARGMGAVQWLEDGAAYLAPDAAATSSGARGVQLVRVECQSGARQVIVPVERLVPEGQTEPLLPSDVQWSADRRKVLLFTNTARVWRHHTRGDYWVLDQAAAPCER
jgi:dipeptidyl-peptidase-4